MIVQIHQCTNVGHPFPILAWLIKLIQSINYSHYAIQYSDNGTELVIDATSKTVREMKSERWRKEYKITRTFFFDIDATEDEVRQWAHLHKGKKYGFLQIVGLLLMILKLVKKNPFGNERENLTCNELTVLFLSRFMGAKLTDTDNYDMNDTETLLYSTSRTHGRLIRQKPTYA